MIDFTHLHVHTEYSLLDGLSKIKPLVSCVKELGMKSLAITDHGAMYGAIHFYNACKEAEIKPIIGCEMYVAKRSRFDKQAHIDSDQYHLIVLAKNQEGYKNLMKLVSIGHLEGYYYKPRIDYEILKQYSKGLIVSSACIEGEIANLIIQRQEEAAEKRIKELLDVFGEDFYLEIQAHPKIKNQDIANKGLIEFSRRLGIPIVATNDSHYIYPEDAVAQDALLAIQTQKKIKDENRLTMLDSPDFYIRSPQEMVKLFKDYPDAIKNTQEIVDKCSLEIELGRWILPNYPIPENETAESFIKKLTREEAKKRFPKMPKEIEQRLDYELDVICKKGFATYFLIVQDFVNWAKAQGIRVGPGRGSVAGSLVSYVLRITSINPLDHNLPFERFMNPERPTPPDIDLDFADIRRDEVLDYVRRKYGDDHVAQIVTFGTMEARMAVRDVARVLDYPYAVGDRISKMIPFIPGKKLTIDKAIEESAELKRAYETELDTKKILDLAKKLVGVCRHASTHAAGVVISDKALTEYVPLQRETKGGETIISQYDMYSLDLNISDKAIGLLKMDFLGLRNLTILQKAKEYVEATEGIRVDISEIPLDDPLVYKEISKGETTGVFQLESQGMRRLAQKLKPNRFSDLSAMIALFRPGPMQWIDEFVNGKRHPEQVKYPHLDLKPVLQETYGIAVYQEQCMQIANVMADYSLGEADLLRRAIGKKKTELMAKEKVRFFERAKKKGYIEKTIEKVWGFIERFAGYGFNKAHSTSYAMIAYQTAWMKAHYPVEFMAALLTAESHSGGQTKYEKVALGVSEARKMGMVILPPDINKSGYGFTIEKNESSKNGYAIRFGLSGVKNVGEAAIEEILKARELGGEFTSLTDFCNRVSPQKVNKKVLESLIKVGALDRFGKKAAMLINLDKIRGLGEKEQKEKNNGQFSLFAAKSDDPKTDLKDNLPDTEEFSREEILSLERELLGFYLTEHPFQEKLTKLKDLVTHKIYQLFLEQEELSAVNNIRIAGIIKNLKIVVTKRTNKEMAFINLEDDTGSIEAVVFPDLFEKSKEKIVKNSIAIFDGKAEKREERGISFITNAIYLENEALSQNTNLFKIVIPAGTSSQKLIKLNQLLKTHPGKDRGMIIFPNGKEVILSFGVDFNPELENEIKKLLYQK